MEKIIDAAEVNELHRLVESGQRLENVDCTHLVLASGKPLKPVLQKVESQLFCFSRYIESEPQTQRQTKNKIYPDGEFI